MESARPCPLDVADDPDLQEYESDGDVTIVAGKRCTCCRQIKILSAFNKHSTNNGPQGQGVQSHCRDCGGARNRKDYEQNSEHALRRHREWRAANPDGMKAILRAGHLRRKYGITPEQYNTMLAAQKAMCAICSTTDPGPTGNFHVDHDHATGTIRALLCNNCNAVLGFAADTPSILYSAARYLERHKLEEDKDERQ